MSLPLLLTFCSTGYSTVPWVVKGQSFNQANKGFRGCLLTSSFHEPPLVPLLHPPSRFPTHFEAHMSKGSSPRKPKAYYACHSPVTVPCCYDFWLFMHFWLRFSMVLQVPSLVLALWQLYPDHLFFSLRAHRRPRCHILAFVSYLSGL